MIYDPETQIVFYLLHFDQEVGRKRHYSGTTILSRLFTRMRKHQRGEGARLTKRAFDQGVGFTLAAYTLLADRSEEYRIKKAGHLRQMCPLCSDSAHLKILNVGLTRFPPLEPTLFHAISFPVARKPEATSTHEKRRASFR